MKSTRRKRTADQSSSIATMRTGSNPALPSSAQPLSRLSSQLYFFDDCFGYANHTTASPTALFPTDFASASTSFCLVTNASENASWLPTERFTTTSASDSISGSKLAGAPTTTISFWSLRFSFLKTGDMGSLRRVRPGAVVRALLARALVVTPLPLGHGAELMLLDSAHEIVVQRV